MSLRAEWLAEVDLVVLLGVLEYLQEPARCLAAAARAGRAVLCSYNTVEYSPDRDRRRRDGWVTDLDIDGFEQVARHAGFRIGRSRCGC
jgi:hypothetical protein